MAHSPLLHGRSESLCGGEERELAEMVGAVERASQAVGMAFGLKKCAVASMHGANQWEVSR